MRCCGNCVDGHYYLRDEGEKLYCETNEYSAFYDEVAEDHCCECHRFVADYETEKNYVFCNKQCFIIIHKNEDNITKILKIYKENERYGIFAFANPEYEDYSEAITFSFRNIEDDDNGLYDIFLDFYARYGEEITFDNCKIKMKKTGDVLWIYFQHLTKSNIPAISIVSNDLESYNTIEQLHTDLSKIKSKKLNMKQLAKIS